MAADATSIGRWRELFGSQVFEALEAAITIAALDDPAELRRRRDHIMELLFAPSPAASHAGIAMSVSAAPVRAGEDVRISKIRGVVGKQDGRELAPTSKALFRPETSARASTTVAVAAALSVPSLEAKVAATKRKLQEGYEEAADAKWQRRIQVIVAPEMANQRRKPVARASRKVCAASSMGPGMRTMLAPSSLGMCS